MMQPKKTNAGYANGHSIILFEKFDADGVLIDAWHEVEGCPNNRFISLKDAEEFANELEPESDLDL